MELEKEITKYLGFMSDTFQFIREDALEAKKDRDNKKREFYEGQLLAYRGVVSLLINQAKAFGIDLKDIKLNDIDPDKDLM